MADYVSPIDPIGKAGISRLGHDTPGTAYAERATQLARAATASQLRVGAPAGVVELSIDPATVAALPATFYLRFLVDDKDGRVIVQVIDSKTDEVLRQVPPKDLREALESLS